MILMQGNMENILLNDCVNIYFQIPLLLIYLLAAYVGFGYIYYSLFGSKATLNYFFRHSPSHYSGLYKKNPLPDSFQRIVYLILGSIFAFSGGLGVIISVLCVVNYFVGIFCKN